MEFGQTDLYTSIYNSPQHNPSNVVPTASPPPPSHSAPSASTSVQISQTQPRKNLPPQEIPCKFFRQGYCVRGGNCWFKHDVEVANQYLAEYELSTSSSTDNRTNRRDSNESGMKVLMTSSAREKARVENQEAQSTIQKDDITASKSECTTEYTCSICYDKPSTFGLLENCNHIFCLECIRHWRSSASAAKYPQDFLADQLSKTSKTCPLCRTISTFIIPSSIFPVDDGDHSPKRVIVEKYLAKLKTIPCRYFLKAFGEDSFGRPLTRRPRCIFGNSCHYAHNNPATGDPYIFTDRELRRMRRGSSYEGISRRARNQMIHRMFGDLSSLGDLQLVESAMDWNEEEDEELMDNLWFVLEESQFDEHDEYDDEDMDEDEDEVEDVDDMDEHDRSNIDIRPHDNSSEERRMRSGSFDSHRNIPYVDFLDPRDNVTRREHEER